MSFVNPIKLPVMRFDSTDAHAPQLNYNARTSGDIKTILKACLVTGYGDKQGAGWSVVEESDFGLSLKSPHVQMVDYVFTFNDDSTTETVWGFYYQHEQGSFEPIKKTPNYIDTNQSGWCMLVAELGFILIERFYTEFGVACRLTYLAQVKSTLNQHNSKNLCYFSVGYGANIYTNNFANTLLNFHINDFSGAKISLPFGEMVGNRNQLSNLVVSFINPIYLSSDKAIVGLLPAILIKTTADDDEIGKYELISYDNRPKIACSLGVDTNSKQYFNQTALKVMIATDFWEF